MKNIFRMLGIISAAIMLIMTSCPTDGDSGGGGGSKMPTLNISNPGKSNDNWSTEDGIRYLIEMSVEIIGALQTAQGLILEIAEGVSVVWKATIEDIVDSTPDISMAAGFAPAASFAIAAAPPDNCLLTVTGAGALEINSGAITAKNAGGTAISSESAITVTGSPMLSGIVDADITISASGTLRVPAGGTLTNLGTMITYGKINNSGMFNNQGTIYNLSKIAITGIDGNEPITTAIPIPTAAVGVTAPVAGNTPDTIAIPGINTYTAGVVTWTLSNGSAFTGSFEGGVSYAATVTLTAITGYIFDSKTIAVMNEDAGATTIVTNTGTTMRIRRIFTPPKPIDNAAVTVTAPVGGAAPTTTATPAADSNFTAGTVSWDPNPADNGGAFISSFSYTANFILTANPGYTFPAGLTATINDQNASVSYNNGATISISFNFTAVEPIPIAAVTVTAPVAGATPDTLANPTGGNNTYGPGTVTWTLSNGSAFTGGFATNTVYTATVTLTANPGFLFVSGTTAAFNGFGAEVVTNARTTITIRYNFPATGNTLLFDIGSLPGSGSYSWGSVSGYTFTVNNNIEITGELATAQGLVFNFGNSSAKVVSSAAITDAAGITEYDLITVTGGGTFEVAAGSSITTTRNIGTAGINAIKSNGAVLVTGGTVSVSPPAGSYIDYAIQTTGTGSVTVSGGEVLTSGSGGHAISSAGNVVISGSTTKVQATGSGNHAISAGSVTVTGAAVTSSSGTAITATTGNVTINGGTVAAGGDSSSAIMAEGNVSVNSGGTVTASGNSSYAIRAQGDATVTNATVTASGAIGSSAITAFGEATVTNSEVKTLSGGEVFAVFAQVSAYVTENSTVAAENGRYAIAAATGAIVVEDSTVTCGGNDGKTIFAEQGIVDVINSTVTATLGTAILAGGRVTVNGGTVTSTGERDSNIDGYAINAAGNVTINGGTITSNGSVGFGFSIIADGTIYIGGTYGTVYLNGSIGGPGNNHYITGSNMFTIYSGATVELNGGFSLGDFAAAGGVFNNSGTLNIYGDNIYSYGTITNSGTLSLFNEASIYNNSGANFLNSNGSTINVNTRCMIYNYGTFTNNGNIYLFGIGDFIGPNPIGNIPIIQP